MLFNEIPDGLSDDDIKSLRDQLGMDTPTTNPTDMILVERQLFQMSLERERRVLDWLYGLAREMAASEDKEIVESAISTYILANDYLRSAVDEVPAHAHLVEAEEE